MIGLDFYYPMSNIWGMETVNSWIRRTTEGHSIRAVALKIGVAQPTLSRQMSEHKVTPETVVAIARAYNANPLEGLEAQGLLNADDLAQYRVAPAWHKVSDRELLDEIERRLTSGAAGKELASGDETLNVAPPRLTLLSGEEIDGSLPYAADTERPGDDPGEDQ